ncbi:MAG: DUF2213 domain-containing protein [Candidatus Sulfotelmatobacter sp.]
MSQAYCGERISKHLIRDNAGFLIALSQPLWRSGWQQYRMSEIDPSSGDDSMVDVYRPPEEVCSAATIASAEGKPITMRHPARFLDSNTVGWSSKGHIQGVRVGPRDENGDITVIGDLHIQDGDLAEKVLSNQLREISMGYTYDTNDGPREGTLEQTNLRMNHCAIVESGRAETTYITDSRGNMSKAKDSKLKQVLDALGDFVKKYSGTKDEEAECNCGGKKQHSDACPCYGKEADDDLGDIAESVSPEGASIGNSIAEGKLGPLTGDDDDDGPSIMNSVMSGAVTAAMLADESAEEMEQQYERTGGPERKLKAFTEVIPSKGSGEGTFVNPVSAKDARTALQNLNDPALRKLVKAQGHTAIDAYNRAYRIIRQQVVASERYEHVLATDSRSRRKADAADFEAQAAKFHGQAIKLHADVNSVEEHRAEDARQPEESFEEMAARYGKEAQERFMPKKRR